MQRIAYRTRIDPFRLAFFVAYWEEKEIESGQVLMPSTYSELVSRGFEDHLDNLISAYPEILKKMKSIVTTEDVFIFLRNRGFHTLQEKTHKRSMIRALQEEHLQGDFDTTREEEIAERRIKIKDGVMREYEEKVLGEKQLDPEEEKEKAQKALKSWKEQGISYEEKEARKAAEQKKAFDEVLGPITEKKKGGK